MLLIAFEEKNVLILYVSIAHKIIRHPNTQYIIYILQYEYPDVHQRRCILDWPLDKVVR